MKRCGICNEQYRVGGGLVYNGEMQRVRACQSCVGKGITIVPTNPAPILCKCGNKAAVCEGCVQAREKKSKVDRDVKAIVVQLRNRAKVYALKAASLPLAGCEDDDPKSNDFECGLRDAYEAAATFVETGKW